MSVVENADYQRQNEPVADNTDIEEQINELNELLAHVLDEISSLKSAIYDKARSEKKVRNPKKKIRSRDDDSDDSDDSTDEVEEKPARPEKVTAPDPLPTRTRNGID